MIYNIKKLKLLRKFNFSNFYGLTNKINVLFKKKKPLKEYRLPVNIKILKTTYNIKLKKLKYYFNKFLFFNLYNFLKILKLRLDFILLTSNLFLTLNQVRQNISHKHVILNNKIAKRSSYCIKSNDIIHIHNINNNLTKKRIIYNYVIKNLNICDFNRKIFKITSIEEELKNLILKLDINNFNNIICNKNFKIKINDENLTDLILNNMLNK